LGGDGTGGQGGFSNLTQGLKKRVANRTKKHRLPGLNKKKTEKTGTNQRNPEPEEFQKSGWSAAPKKGETRQKIEAPEHKGTGPQKKRPACFSLQW